MVIGNGLKVLRLLSGFTFSPTLFISVLTSISAKPPVILFILYFNALVQLVNN